MVSGLGIVQREPILQLTETITKLKLAKHAHHLPAVTYRTRCRLAVNRGASDGCQLLKLRFKGLAGRADAGISNEAGRGGNYVHDLRAF